MTGWLAAHLASWIAAVGYVGMVVVLGSIAALVVAGLRWWINRWPTRRVGPASMGRGAPSCRVGRRGTG